MFSLRSVKTDDVFGSGIVEFIVAIIAIVIAFAISALLLLSCKLKSFFEIYYLSYVIVIIYCTYSK